MSDDEAREELRQRILAAGCDGAFDADGCGCELADLAPCEGTTDPEHLADCIPGYKHDCIGNECAHPCDGRGDWCITKSPDGPKRREPEEARPVGLIDRAALRERIATMCVAARPFNAGFTASLLALDAAPTVECAACAAHENCSIESEMLYIVKYPERLNGAMCCALFQRRQS